MVELTGTTVADNAVLGMSRAEIQAKFEEALRSHGGFVLPAKEEERAAGKRTGSRASLDLAFTRYVQRDAEAKTAAEVGARLLLFSPGEDGEEDYEVPGGAEVLLTEESPQARTRALRRALDDALEQAVAAMYLQLAAIRKEDAALVGDLKSTDPRVKGAAVRVLADRRNPAVTPELLERLDSEDPALIRRTIGQLVEIRDPTAVEPLIELARGKDPGFVREIVYALGALGGDEAEAYLDTVASGHDQSAVRKAAAEALAELRAKRSGRPTGASRASAEGEGK